MALGVFFEKAINKKPPPLDGCLFGWCARTDSNRGPSD